MCWLSVRKRLAADSSLVLLLVGNYVLLIQASICIGCRGSLKKKLGKNIIYYLRREGSVYKRRTRAEVVAQWRIQHVRFREA